MNRKSYCATQRTLLFRARALDARRVPFPPPGAQRPAAVEQECHVGLNGKRFGMHACVSVIGGPIRRTRQKSAEDPDQTWPKLRRNRSNSGHLDRAKVCPISTKSGPCSAATSGRFGPEPTCLCTGLMEHVPLGSVASFGHAFRADASGVLEFRIASSGVHDLAYTWGDVACAPTAGRRSGLCGEGSGSAE